MLRIQFDIDLPLGHLQLNSYRPLKYTVHNLGKDARDYKLFSEHLQDIDNTSGLPIFSFDAYAEELCWLNNTSYQMVNV